MTPAVPPALTPQPDARPHPVVRAIHSHAVGYSGALVAIVALLAPVLTLLTNPAFVDALLWNPDRLVRADHFHQLVTALVVSVVLGVLGVVAANTGKGVLSPHVDDTN